MAICDKIQGLVSKKKVKLVLLYYKKRYTEQNHLLVPDLGVPQHGPLLYRTMECGKDLKNQKVL